MTEAMTTFPEWTEAVALSLGGGLALGAVVAFLNSWRV